jgi:hypothetical protein
MLNYFSNTPLAEAMNNAQKGWEKERSAAEREAVGQLVGKPSVATLLAQSNQQLSEDDDPLAMQALRVLTRRDAPGISLVCLHRVNNQICLDAEGSEPVDVNHLSPVLVRQLARRIIAVSSYPLVEHFRSEDEIKYPPRWKKIAALRHARLALFENNEYIESPKFTLRLTQALGLQIDYRKSGGQDDDL